MRNALKIKTSLAALAAMLAVAGCSKAPTDAADNAQVSFALPELPATLPLAAGTGEPITYAPEASALPDVEPLRVGRVADPQQAYGYADAAYEYSDALGDAPPDYGFDYEGSEPWAWQGYDNSLAFAEPVDDGYRTYYYRPGAEEPYFIRDPYYSYGFADGLLSVIYAADGGIVPYADYGPRLAYASRYYSRGRSLYGASRRGNRRAIYASNWRAQSPIIFASRQRWGAGRAHQPAWGAYHNANFVRQQGYWREETVRRRADSQRFAEWRANDFRTPAPARAIPAAWTGAKWARDNSKFRPASDTVRQAVRQERQQQARQDERAAAQGQKAAQQRVEQRQALREDRQQDRAQTQRQQQAERQQDRRQDQTQTGRQQQQADRQQAGRQQAERQQDRAQAQRQQQAERQQNRAQAQQQTQRQQQADRQEQRQQDRSQAERQQAQRQQQAERQQQRAQAQPQRQQPAARVEQRRDQAAERQQAARAQAQAAQREQRQQAQQVDRQKAQQAQRQQAQQAQRQQAQAERQTQRAEPRPQPERARQQPQPQAQPRPQVQQRQEVRQQRQEQRQQQRSERPNRQ